MLVYKYVVMKIVDILEVHSLAYVVLCVFYSNAENFDNGDARQLGLGTSCSLIRAVNIFRTQPEIAHAPTPSALPSIS